MGLFSGFKSGSDTADFWLDLNQVDQLDAIIEDSKTKPVVLFKHSTRCSISSMAKNHFEQGHNNIKDPVDVYLLDLLSYRNISNEIASRFGVEHQSPQMILIKDGTVQLHSSHNSIKAEDINNYL